ncbi:MAG: MotE family protein, partial [Rhizobiales bacterium]|nr:MotE family protein [Hyphomicrobiales bacterium]
IADKAADARVAWQTANLRKLETEVAAKLSALDAREAELKDWVGKRDAMVKAASRELVDIYAKMDTEAAAAQLAKVETVTATSILRQLSPRAAGAILAVMDAERAATLVRMIAAPTKDLPPGGGT